MYLQKTTFQRLESTNENTSREEREPVPAWEALASNDLAAFCLCAIAPEKPPRATHHRPGVFFRKNHRWPPMCKLNDCPIPQAHQCHPPRRGIHALHL